jgi:shikimate dehydrogenase
MNVTAPFKLAAFAYADVRSRAAELAGAANALKFERESESGVKGGRVLAENFDGLGLVRDVVHNLGHAMAGRRVLLLGAGGASRGALLPILAQHPSGLVIANRHVDKAAELAAMAMANQDSAVPMVVQVAASSYADLAGQSFDIVFNATSSSLTGELPPVPASVFAQGCLAYDLTYGKGMTPFLKLAQEAGVQHLADGVGMLAEQAAEAFLWWRGVRPDTRAVIDKLTVPLLSTLSVS